MANVTGGSPNGAWGLFVMDDDFDDRAAGSTVAGAWTFFPHARCAGQRATLASNVGTAGRDTLTGTPGDDVLLGLGGKDRVNGLGGSDVICGGGGPRQAQRRPGRRPAAG